MLCEKIGDLPIEKIIVDPSASGFIATIQKYGKYIVEGANNDVLVGIQEVTKYHNLGLLKIHESCEKTIKEIDKKARKVLAMLKRGVKFTPTQPDVLAILEKLNKL